MLARLNRARPVIGAWILAAALTLLATATAFAGGGGTPYPH
jgi:hypothetical protein